MCMLLILLIRMTWAVFWTLLLSLIAMFHPVVEPLSSCMMASFKAIDFSESVRMSVSRDAALVYLYIYLFMGMQEYLSNFLKIYLNTKVFHKLVELHDRSNRYKEHFFVWNQHLDPGFLFLFWAVLMCFTLLKICMRWLGFSYKYIKHKLANVLMSM